MCVHVCVHACTCGLSPAHVGMVTVRTRIQSFIVWHLLVCLKLSSGHSHILSAILREQGYAGIKVCMCVCM